MDSKILKLIDNFRLRNIEAFYFETLDDAVKVILCMIPSDCTVGIGHSVTLQKMNISVALAARGNIVYDKELACDKKEAGLIKKKAMLADWYISGANAVSVDGRIVNVDHSGNRAAAITFGPDRVIIVAGINKVTDTMGEAIYRVKNIACPKNARRAGHNPPCVSLNKCVDCVSPERVCNTLSIIEGQADRDRMKLFIVNEEAGF